MEVNGVKTYRDDEYKGGKYTSVFYSSTVYWLSIDFAVSKFRTLAPEFRLCSIWSKLSVEN